MESQQNGGANFETQINIEGVEHKWRRPTITAEEIAELGGWGPEVGVIAVDPDNNERTLTPGEVIPLALALGSTFGRRIRFKRGRAERMQAELDLLREVFPDAQASGDWVLLPNQSLPEGWSPTQIDVALLVPSGFPGTSPYGIYVPSNLSFRGEAPKDFTPNCGQELPFPGTWGRLSWAVERDWVPTTSVRSGASLLRYVRSFHQRFAEGA